MVGRVPARRLPELQEALLRVAHRHGLLMSAPELAQHLQQICGPPEQWRELEPEGSPGTQAGGGTEVYDMSGADGTGGLDDDLDLDDDDVEEEDDDADAGPVMIAPRIKAAQARAQRQKTSITHLSRLEVARHQDAFDREAQLVISAAAERINGHLSVLDATHAFVSAARHVDIERFSVFAQHWFPRFGGIAAIGLSV